MVSEEGTLVLVFNGEIYNYPALRDELSRKGYAFRTNCDTEVLLHVYAEYGDALPTKLRGMFAFAIWDKSRKRLFAARDLFGIKPFYYAQMGSTFLFGSEIKGFFAHPAFEKRFNRRLLPAYLSFQYTAPCEETFFEGVYKLPPAHTLICEGGRLTVSAYDALEFNPEPSSATSPDEWADRIDAVLAASVEAHKQSDVEVCSFLSSGVDSSYIAALAGVNKTFTVGFDIIGGGYSEIDYAKALSDLIGAENHSRIIRPTTIGRRSARCRRRWTSRSPIHRRSRSIFSVSWHPSTARSCFRVRVRTSFSVGTTSTANRSPVGHMSSSPSLCGI